MCRIFDKKLYLEGIRYLKGFGIITTILLTVFPLFMLVSEVFDSIGTNEIAREYVSAWSLNPVLVLLFCAVAPLMTIILFNFTTGRAASDFYFSVPKTRKSLYFSFFLSIITWIGIILAFSVGVPMVLSLILNKFLAFNVGSSLVFVLQLLVSCVYVIAACLIAISVTGTVFSNIVVALLLIFVPRLFILVIVNSGMNGLYYADAIETLPLLSYHINLPVGFVINAFFMGSFDLVEGAAPIIYTTVVGIVYLIIGMVLFDRRDSGASGKAAATDKLRAIFRIILGASVGIAASSIFFSTWGSRWNNNVALDDFSTWFAIIAVLTVAFAVYCCYDLIMTKSLRKMVKAMPAFLIALAIDIVAVLGMYGVLYTVESYTPAPEDINGVYLVHDDYDSAYFGEVTSDLKINDPVINKIVSTALKENVETVKSLKNGGAEFFEKYSEHDELRLYIESRSGKHYRILQISQSDYAMIVEQLSKNDDYKKAFTHLPDLKKNKGSVYVDSELKLTEEQRDMLYETFSNEVKSGEVPFETYYNNITGGVNGAVFGMYCDAFYGSDSYTINLHVTRDYKKTVDLYLSFVDMQNEKEGKKLVEVLNSVNAINVEIYFDNAFDGDKNFVYSDENLEKLAKILKGAKTKDITSKDKTILLTYWRHNEKDYVYDPKEDEVYQARFSLSDSDIKALEELTEPVEELGYHYYK